MHPDLVSRTAKLCSSRMEAMLFKNVFIILQYQTCHISGHSKMSGLLILSQTTIKFPSEFFGPFQPLSIPNINRSSLIARESRGCWERREIAEAIPGGWLMAGECPCVPGTLAMFGHSGPGARGRGNSLCPVIPRPRHMSEQGTHSQSGNIFTGTWSPQNGPSADNSGMRQVTSDFITWEYCLSFSLRWYRSCFKPKIDTRIHSSVNQNTV